MNPNEGTIGTRLRAQMERRGISQTALAAASGVSQSLISRVLSGAVKSLHDANLRKLASALEIQVELISGPGVKRIITVGSASGERVLTFKTDELITGLKYTMEPSPLLSGGSGVNHSARLLSVGVDVWPVIPVAEDDVGRVVMRTLSDAARSGQGSIDLRSVPMQGEELSTPFTTILSEEGGKRTILNEFPAQALKPFARHSERRLDEFRDRHDKAPDAVMIGHVHGDRSTETGGLGGGISQSIIERYHREGTSLFTNFGSAQYRLGAGRWEHILERVAFFQLDIDEIRFFCDDVARSLIEILAWFKRRCTLIITMDRMGAIALRKGSDRFIVAWPYELESIRDSTGAGDAFAAGLVASAIYEPIESDSDLARSLDQARLWGAYACTTLGGASDCPDREALARFRARHSRVRPIEILPLETHESILFALDRAFPRRAL